MPEEIGSALGRKLKQSAPRCSPHRIPVPYRGTPLQGDSRTYPEPIPAEHQGSQHRMDTRARLTGLSAGTAAPASAVGEGLGEGGTGGHLDCRQGLLAQQSPTEPCLPWPPLPWSPHPPFPALGRTGPSVPPRGSRCWHWGSLCDRAAGAGEAGAGARPGPQPARGDSSHPPGSHSGSVTLGSETQTTEGPKPQTVIHTVDIPFGQMHLTQQYQTGSKNRGWESAVGQRRMAEQRFHCRPGGCAPHVRPLRPRSWEHRAPIASGWLKAE